MTVPPWMSGPDVPDPRFEDPARARVLSQEPGPNGTIRVTFALPGLRRQTLTVPEASWLNGEHLFAGAMLPQLMTAIEPTIRDDVSPAVQDDGDTSH